METYPRRAGVVIPAFALRHEADLGIGDTLAVREAITFCAEHHLGLLQLLPVNETGQDNSPYNAISSVALDPVYLALTPDQVPGLKAKTLARLAPPRVRAELQAGPVDYARVKQLKLDILAEAYVDFEAADLAAGSDPAYQFQEFVEQNMGWLRGYTLFRTLLNEHNGSALWPEWPADHQSVAAGEIWIGRSPERDELVRYRQFTAYVQWVAWRQWREVRAWADRQNVRLIGDIPFGVSRYSADVWAERELFDITWSGGAPPEPFFQSGEFVRKWGQNWGIPLYDWEAHRMQNFAWWRQRIGLTGQIFHAFRIDHVLGFFRIYGFPWQPQQNEAFLNLTPEEAQEKAGGRVPHFLPRPDEPEANAALNHAEGEALLRAVQQAAGATAVVAEDLGMVPPYVGPALQKLGIPGFVIPHFRRDPKTDEFLPAAEMPPLAIATWGSHDHAPIRLFYEDLARRWKGPDGHQPWLELQRFMRFLGRDENAPPETFTDDLHRDFLRVLLEAPPCWAIFMISDVLGLPLQFNHPGTAGADNWSQRLDRPLAAYAQDPAFAPVLAFLREEIAQAKREP